MSEKYEAYYVEEDGTWSVLTDTDEVVATDLQEYEAVELADTLNDAVYGDYGD